MRIRKIVSIVFAVMLCCVSAFAAGSFEQTAKFDVKIPDDEKVLELTVSFENMSFLTYQFALRYDTSALLPINPETKKEAQLFEDFAVPSEHKGISFIGEKLDTKNGLFTFAGYVFPGTQTDELLPDENGVKTGENFVLYKMYFRILSQKKSYFEIASDDGGKYFEEFPLGFQVFGLKSELNITCAFKRDGERIFEEIYTPVIPEVHLTKQERLENTLFLQNANYAAAKDSYLSVIDRDNKAVTPSLSQDTLFVPLRYVCENFGFEVLWDDKTKTASISKDGKTFTINKIQALDGQKPYISNSRYFVPASALSELMGVKYIYFGDIQSCIFYTGDDWQPERKAETEALSAMQFVTSPFIRIFG